jgi:RHS repeat-associated protein
MKNLARTKRGLGRGSTGDVAGRVTSAPSDDVRSGVPCEARVWISPRGRAADSIRGGRFGVPISGGQTIGKRVRPEARIVLLAVWFLGSTSCLLADQPAETLPGFKPNNVLEVRGIDNVNLFNGDPGVVVPLGPDYPLGPGYRWQLTAHYSVKFWKLDIYECTYQQFVHHAFVSGYPTLGAGWTLELGYVSTDDVGESAAAGIYHSPDGGRHPFFGTSQYLTRDGTHLRVSKPTSTSYQVEFPDGSRHVFAHAYTRPRPTAGPSYDFNDVNWGAAASTTPRYGLTSIEDSFDATLLRVNYLSSTWKVSSIVLNPNTPQERSIDFTWGTQQVGTGTPVTWEVLSSIKFPAAGSRELTVEFGFHPSSSTFQRPVYDNSVELGICINPNTVFVPLLQAVNFWDRSLSPPSFLMSYGFDYQLTDPFGGVLIQTTLPTKGIVGYAYDKTTEVCWGGFGCTSDLEASGGSGFASAPLAPDPEREDLSLYWDTSAAVVQRTETDPYTSVATSVSYDRYQVVPLDGLGKPIKSKIVRRTIVTSPSGNPGVEVATKHLFHVEVSSALGGTGVELARRYYQDTNASGTPIRSLINCWESDYAVPPACGYKDSFGNLQGYTLTDNVRRQAGITWYGENPTGGGTCSSGGTHCTASVNSGYDTTAGKYRTNIVTSTLPGVPGWMSRTTTTEWTPATGPWLLDIFSSRTVEDAEATPGALPLPRSVTTLYTFNTNDGFLDQVSTADATYGTLKRDFTRDASGNPQTERIYGQSGPSGDFTDVRTYQSGLVTSTQRSGISWKSFDVTRDPDTGLITQSRDPNGLATNYDYDALGRLTLISPPGGELPTKICHLSAVTGNPSFVIVKKSSGDPCARDDGTPAVGSDAFDGYQYDGFGRLIREIRRLPNQLSTTSYFSKKETRYDAAGHRAFLSEWTPCPLRSPVPDPTTSISNCAFPVPQPSTGLTGTTWSSFEPLGRAQLVTKADGTTTATSYADGSIAFSDSLESVTVNNVSGSPATTVTRRDALGRVIAVEEPTIAGMRGDTAYTYNVLDRLGKVTQPPDATSPPQVRAFTYDAFGFLRSETHPEKATTYGGYDALGNVLSETEGGVTSIFVYDAAGRLTREIAAGVAYVTNCYDGALTCADGNAGFSGGTYKFGRLTRRYGFNPRSPRQPRVTEDLTYALSIGPGLSKKTTTFTSAPHTTMPAINETWTYNSLGLVDTYGLPFAGATPNVSAALQYKSGLPTKLTSGTQTLVESAEYNPSAALSKWIAGSPNNVVTNIFQDISLMPRPRQITTTGFDSGIYSYDGAGNILSIGSDSFTYDARSRVKTGLGQTFQYDRYGNLNPASVNYLTNRLTTAAYDDRGNQLRGNNQIYRYDELSRQIALDGGTERYLHNGAGERIVRVTSTAPGLSFYTITPCRVYDTRSSPGTPLTPGVSLNVQMTGGCGIPAEAEAIAGNLTATGSTSGGYILAQPAGTSGLETSTINFSGGQTRANNFNLGLSTAGQLGLTASTTVHAIVDANGYYAYAGAASQETWSLTLRDGDNRLATDYTVTSAGTTRKRNYFYFGHLLVATRDETGTVWRFYASDHLGTPRVVTSSTGSVIETHKYKAFGEEIGGSFGLQPLKFAAMERDAASGNDFDHARYLSSTLGRFLSPDRLQGKLFDPQSWNRYAYARNNPVRLLDPNGLDFTVAATFTNSNLSLRQQIAALRQVGAVYTQAGVKNVTVTLNGATVFKSPFDQKAHELGHDQRSRLNVSGTNPDIDGKRRGESPGLAPGQANVSLATAPSDSPGRDTFTVNVSTHELGHTAGLLDNDRAPGTVMEVPGQPPSDQIRQFSPEDAKGLRLYLNGYESPPPPPNPCAQNPSIPGCGGLEQRPQN